MITSADHTDAPPQRLAAWVQGHRGYPKNRLHWMRGMSAVKYLDSAGVNVLFKHSDEIDHLHLIVHPL